MANELGVSATVHIKSSAQLKGGLHQQVGTCIQAAIQAAVPVSTENLISTDLLPLKTPTLLPVQYTCVAALMQVATCWCSPPLSCVDDLMWTVAETPYSLAISPGSLSWYGFMVGTPRVLGGQALEATC